MQQLTTTVNFLYFSSSYCCVNQIINNKKYGKKVVLSLDGGALKGIIQLKILEELNKIILDKTDLRKTFKDKFCEELSKIFNLTKDSISDKLSHFNQDCFYMKALGGKDILDALYDNFWDKASDDKTEYYISPDTKVDFYVAIFNILGGHQFANGNGRDIIPKTFFTVRDEIGISKKAIDGKSIMDFIELVGGVSVGSFISTCPLLQNEKGSYKYSISDCMEILKTLPEKYFEKSWIPFFQPVLKRERLLEGMKAIFGEKSTFNDLVGDKKLLISSTNLDTCKNTIWTNLVDSKSWDENFKNDSTLKDIRYVDVSEAKLYDAVNSSSSYLMALPAHKVKYKLLN